MKKFASFLVDKRKILLCFFLVLAAVSLPLAGMVNINYDLTEYLGSDSRMKQGMQLMEQEFGAAASSGLRVMFSGLEEGEKEDIHSWLSGLEQVSEVRWEPGEKYNRDGYTLYELTTEYDSHSAEAASLYRAVHDRYDSRGVVTGGEIHESNVPILPLYIIIVSVGLCWKSGVAAELIGRPKGTIGAQLWDAKTYLEVQDAFAWTVTVILLSLAFQALVLYLLKTVTRRLEKV